MAGVLALMRDPSPGIDLVPYLGDHILYDQVLRIAAKDKIAINRAGTWYGREPGQSFEDALRTLQQYTMPNGSDWATIQLGLPSEMAGGGVAVTPGSQGTLFGGTGPTPPGATPPTGPSGPTGPTVVPPPVGPTTPSPTGPTVVQPPDDAIGATEPTPVQPVIRRSLGPKTGINLLGDLEKWALPDAQRVTQATLTFSGISIKELRELCTKLPQKIAGELQITLPPENRAEPGNGGGKGG
jgi:hypothetical protein